MKLFHPPGFWYWNQMTFPDSIFTRGVANQIFRIIFIGLSMLLFSEKLFGEISTLPEGKLLLLGVEAFHLVSTFKSFKNSCFVKFLWISFKIIFLGKTKKGWQQAPRGTEGLCNGTKSFINTRQSHKEYSIKKRLHKKKLKACRFNFEINCKSAYGGASSSHANFFHE